MRVDRDAAAVVGDGQAPVARAPSVDLDAAGVAGDRLVHRIVDDLGGEVVERAVVGPADVHAGAAADRLEPLEHLDRGCVVAVGRGGRGGGEQVGHVPTGYMGRDFRPAKKAAPRLSTAEAVIVPRAIESGGGDAS